MTNRTNDNIITNSNSLVDFKKKFYLKVISVVAVFMFTIVLLFTITAAWYSNIVEVEEFTFDVDSWGVDAVIHLIDNDIYRAAPGDSNVIPYKIDNNADRLVNIQFNAYKQYLPDFMQQRIYFYLDKKTEINGELLDRIYIHDDNAYYYPLLGGQLVDNTGEILTDRPLKWEWVYDLLGYYVIVRTDADGISTEVSYIRPVQYIYENARYDYSTGQLSSIKNSDGTVTSLDQFVLDLVATDGLQCGTQTEEGLVPPEKLETAQDLVTTLKFKDITGEVVEKNYYKIYDDQVNNYGIYMYLCDYYEIGTNNKIDVDIADRVNVYQLTEDNIAVVQLSCGQAMEYYIDVTDAAQLAAILKNDLVTVKDESGADITISAYESLLKSKNLWEERDHVIIRLGADMTLDPMLITNCNMIIDLNGHTISSSALAPIFTLEPGCKLRMYNGTIDPQGAVPVLSTASTVVLRDVMINTTGAAVSIQTAGYPQGSNVQLINCTWKPERPAESAAVIELDVAQNVPSFISVRDIPVVEEQTEEQTTGEVTE